MSDKTYILDETSGELKAASAEPQTKIGVFLYEKGEDITTIEGHAPLVFDNVDQLSTYFKKEIRNNLPAWFEEEESVLVIRKLKVLPT